jgi:anti-sigma-K factor RskA
MNDELHALVGAYALDALDERERAVYEQHLTECPTCAAEVREFQATAARLGEAASTPPPPGLRESVLEAARRTPQQRPVVTVVPASRWRRHAPKLLAAAMVIAIVGVVGLYLDEKDEKTDLQTENSRIEAIMKAPDMVVSPTGVADPQVKVVSSESLDEAVVMVDHLPPIDEEHSYEMWAIDAEGAHSLGAMPADTEEGKAVVDGLGDATQVAVTVEPAGGSPNGRPSSPPVEVVDLA